MEIDSNIIDEFQRLIEALENADEAAANSFFKKPDVLPAKLCDTGLDASRDIFKIDEVATTTLLKSLTDVSPVKLTKYQRIFNFAKTLEQDYNIRYNLSRRQSACIHACNSKRLSRDLRKIINIGKMENDV